MSSRLNFGSHELCLLMATSSAFLFPSKMQPLSSSSFNSRCLLAFQLLVVPKVIISHNHEVLATKKSGFCKEHFK